MGEGSRGSVDLDSLTRSSDSVESSDDHLVLGGGEPRVASGAPTLVEDSLLTTLEYTPLIRPVEEAGGGLVGAEVVGALKVLVVAGSEHVLGMLNDVS